MQRMSLEDEDAYQNSAGDGSSGVGSSPRKSGR